MKFNFDSYRSFANIAKEYSFKNEEGIYTSDLKLPYDTSFGIDKNNFLYIILPLKNEISGFQLKDFLTLKDNVIFFSDNKEIKLEGSPLIFKEKKIRDQYSFLSQIDLLLDSENFVSKLNHFFELLQKARNSRTTFNAASFFAELCTIKKLLNFMPTIANQWASSANSTIDFLPSAFNPAIEVKSTTSQDQRIHKFSINQIRYFQNDPSSLISSVIVHEFENGISCKDICKSLLLKLEPKNLGFDQINAALIAYSELNDFNNCYFDEGTTLSSIKFYNPDFKELPLQTPPFWLKGGKLDVDMSVLKESDEFNYE